MKENKENIQIQGISSILIIAFALVASGCELSPENIDDLGKIFNRENQGPGKQPDPPVVKPSCFAQRLVQPKGTITRQVDLLFVTDTSGSLYSERRDIADGIDAFIREIPSNVDINIGLLLGHGSNSKYAGKLYRKKSNAPYVLKSSKLTVNEIRSHLRYRLTNTAGDWSTDGGEAGLWALTYALTGSRLEALQKQGMLRKTAALAIIFIADENAICARYPKGVKRVYDPNKLELPAFNFYCPNVTHESTVDLVRKIKGKKPLLIGGLVYSDRDSVPRGGENEYGWGYMEAIKRANGVAINLANGHYDRGLAEIGRLTTLRLKLITEMLLANKNVDPNTIKVKVDGAPSTFTYNPSTNILNLLQPGGAQSVVDVNYCLKKTGGCTGLGCGGGIGV